VRLNYPGAEDTPGHGFVKARVGVSGTKVSLMIDRSQLPRFAPFTTFQWDVLGVTQGSNATQVYDCAPDKGPNPVYPPGAPPARTPSGCGL